MRRGPDLFVSVVYTSSSVALFQKIHMKLPKFGILVNKTTYLFTSIREQYFQGVCEHFGNSGGEGGGVGG